MRKSLLNMFGGLRTELLCLQARHVGTKAGVAEVLKNSLHLRVKVSEYIEFEGEVPLEKKQIKPKNVKLDSRFHPKPKRSPNQKGAKRFTPTPSPDFREKRDRKYSGKHVFGKSHSKSHFPNSSAERPSRSLSEKQHDNIPPRSPLVPLEFTLRCERNVRPNDEELKQVHKPNGESIPKLAHKLDRVLFSPGVHFLQDPRTRVYNFNPYLKHIVSHEDFDFQKVQKFVSASKDKSLLQEAKEQNKKFYSSTSSMTLTLHQFYLFLNNYSPNPESKYRFGFPDFSKTARELPLAVFVEPKGVNESNGEKIYSVTSDKSTDVEILLSAMGHCLEALLTTEEEEFKELLIKRDDKEENMVDSSLIIEDTPEPTTGLEKEETPENSTEYKTDTESAVSVAREAVEIAESAKMKESTDIVENVYNYLGYGDFLMRSQLDCYDPRLPGNGTFDLKTRAAASIRYDKSTEASDSKYQIWKLNGNTESFQREYEDLMRTGGLLKYGFQARIGQMDGIFVAYHNINSFFGFQYLPLSEIDKVFYSNENFAKKVEEFSSAEEIEQNENMASIFAESQFKASLNIWQDIMKTVEEDFKGTKFEGSPFRLVMNRMSKVKQKKPRSSVSKSTPGKLPLRVESVLSVFAVPLSRSEVNSIQQVSSKYQTSFREDISDEERLRNLEKIQDELDDFNEQLVKKNLLFSYVVNASLYVNGYRASGIDGHPYPYSAKDDIEWRYNIQRICEKKDHETTKADTTKGESKGSSERLVEKYLRATQMCTNMLTKAYKEWPALKQPTLTDTLRKYSEVGKLRLEKWDELENPPRVY